MKHGNKVKRVNWPSSGRTCLALTVVWTIQTLFMSVWYSLVQGDNEVWRSYFGKSEPHEPAIGSTIAASVTKNHERRIENWVLWYAPFMSGGGYSSEARSYIVGMNELFEKRDSQAWIYSLAAVQFAETARKDIIDGISARERNIVEEYLKRALELSRNNIVAVCHSTPDAWVPSKFSGWDYIQPCPPRSAKYRIGRTMFETDSLPVDWVDRCNKMDEIWVPSHFHVNVFRESGVNVPLVYIPQGVDTSFFSPSDETNTESTKYTKNRSYRFLSIFKFERRKGYDVLLKAFFNEFSVEDNVELIIKTSPFHMENSIEDEISSFAENNNFTVNWNMLTLIVNELTSLELLDLYRRADAFVLPSRGEGWGRPHVEAMAVGLPVLATNFGGPSEYMNENNSFPLRYSLQNASIKGLKSHKWAEPDVLYLKRLLRLVYENPEHAKKIGQTGRKTMLDKFSLRKIAKIVDNRLATIFPDMNT